MSAADGIRVGRVVRPWGRHGAVLVAPSTHDVTRFQRLSRVLVAPATADRHEPLVERGLSLLRIDRHGRPLVQIEGIESIDDAETLRGCELLVPESQAERPNGDAYFNHELIGAVVETVSGEVVGEVRDVIEAPAGNLLEVVDGGHEMLIPARREIVAEVDVTGRRIVIRHLPGLLEANEHLRDAVADVVSAPTSTGEGVDAI